MSLPPSLLLLLAILAETAATTALKAAAGFTRPLPSLLTVAGYAVSFYCLSLALRSIPIGVAYAIWSGIGIVLVSLLAWLLYRQALDLPALIGIALILAGVAVINLFSRASGHA